MTRLAATGIKVLQWVGRWILSRLSDWGRWKLVRYMSRKIRKFKRRADKWETRGRNLRSKWNELRAGRWTKAKRWIQRHWLRLSKKAADRLDGVIADAVETYVLPEGGRSGGFHHWARGPEGRALYQALSGLGISP